MGLEDVRISERQHIFHSLGFLLQVAKAVPVQTIWLAPFLNFIFQKMSDVEQMSNCQMRGAFGINRVSRCLMTFDQLIHCGDNTVLKFQ